jgi:acetylglutamate kinase
MEIESLMKTLPDNKKYFGKTIVVKYGGNAMINAELKSAVIEDIVFLASMGINVVLVHGGGPEIEAMLKAIGKESRFVQGLRYTDEETMNIVQMVLCGKVNKDLVSLMQQNGGKAGIHALGLCGIDGGLLQAKQLKANGEDLGFVGEVINVNASVIEDVLQANYIPVISTVALGIDEVAGHAMNINADTAAAKIAAALKAEKLILMTDIAGILRDVNDPSSLITQLEQSQLAELITSGIVTKGMIPKVNCLTTALDGGVKQACIIDGRMKHSILLDLFSDEKIGTTIKSVCLELT